MNPTVLTSLTLIALLLPSSQLHARERFAVGIGVGGIGVSAFSGPARGMDCRPSFPRYSRASRWGAPYYYGAAPFCAPICPPVYYPSVYTARTYTYVTPPATVVYPLPQPLPVYSAPSFRSSASYSQSAPTLPLVAATGLPLPENQVAQVQAALQQRKYYHGRVDGIFGPATEAAIRAYQLDRSLRVTGKIDATLLSDLGL
ncbi:MAG: hypothetical protein RLZZ244_636 [Verrucomicrobiota bacterium]|jgi:hypothetical protein